MKRLQYPVRAIVCPVIILVACHTFAPAQDILTERLLEQSIEFSDQSTALDYIEEIASRPVAVNAADLEELLQIPGITPEQAGRIVSYRDDGGTFTEMPAVQRVAQIPQNWFVLILPFLSLNLSDTTPFLEVRQRFQRTIDESRGFSTDAFKGTAVRNYTRLTARFSNTLSFGALLEKDPGEKDFNDHSVLFVQYRSENNREHIIAGNYSLDFAQGLLFSRKSLFTKSQDPIHPLLRREQNGRRYVSSSESEGFLGLYGRYTARSITLNVFGARTKRDATISDEGSVTSIRESGLHRTGTERSQRNNLDERLFGFRTLYAPGTSVRFGFTGASVRYDRLFLPKNTGALLFKFSGKSLSIYGVDFNVRRKKLELCGALGISKPGSYGLVNGIVWSEQGTKFSMHVRKYGRDFYSPFGNSFADRTSEIRNEQGIYVGVLQRLSGKFDLSFYLDVFKHPWRSTAIPVSESGREYFGQIQYGLSKKEIQGDHGITRSVFTPLTNNKVRLQGVFQVHRNVKMTSRIELQTDQDGTGTVLKNIFKEPGFLWSLRSSVTMSQNTRLTLNTIIFSGKSFRFYHYEPDVPGVLTIKQLTDEGERFSVLLDRSWK